jgi:hypothetical protein
MCLSATSRGHQGEREIPEKTNQLSKLKHFFGYTYEEYAAKLVQLV